MYRSEYKFTNVPGRRRNNINNIIDKLDVLSESCRSVNFYQPYQSKIMYRQYQRQLTGSTDNLIDDSSTMYDENEITSTSYDSDNLQNKLVRLLLPIWLILKPVLETITIAPLPLFFSVTGTGIFALFTIFIMPRALSELILYPGFRLVFGTLYPAYASYKAVRTKNVKEYVSKFCFYLLRYVK